MTKLNQVYKCNVCGNVVQVIHGSDGELVCCGEPMKLMDEQTADFKTEKHVPIIERIANGFKVIIGSTPHPMEAEHYIEWIEFMADDISYRKYLEPGDSPEATFEVEAGNFSAREYCNKHGLWKNQ